MTLVTVLILVAVAILVTLLALAPRQPARRNPFLGRRHRATHRGTTPRPGGLPHQRGLNHHAR
ncbi:hypothetical protein ACFYYB_33020 [Streptomyces sp. NPDC002886]|uniref:hypothetical protein n=1 Tax=Streptomyces sp. NPDC002886 TaxID=3364667 RepID=UPI0036CE2EF5